MSRPLRRQSGEGGPAYGIELRTTVVDSHRIATIVGLNPKPVAVRLVALAPAARWRDLVGGATGTGSTFTIQPPDVLLLDLGQGAAPGERGDVTAAHEPEP